MTPRPWAEASGGVPGEHLLLLLLCVGWLVRGGVSPQEYHSVCRGSRDGVAPPGRYLCGTMWVLGVCDEGAQPKPCPPGVNGLGVWGRGHE